MDNNIRFILVLVIIGIITEITYAINKDAAWIFVVIIILALLLNNQFVLAWVSYQVSQLRVGV